MYVYVLLAYADLLDTEKFCYLQLVNWKSRKAHDKIPVSFHLKAEDQCPGSSIVEQRIIYSLPNFSCSTQVANGLNEIHPHLGGQPLF